MNETTNCENNQKCGSSCPMWGCCAGETAASAVFNNNTTAILSHNRGEM